MKKLIPIYYLLFILLIMGAFASMAQNSYGLKIMGGVAFAFTLVFLIEFIAAFLKKGNKDIYKLLELACLLILSVIFAFRVFYIYFSFVELLFGAACILLGLFYLRKMILLFRSLQSKNRRLAMLGVVFYFSILLFLISLVLVQFAPKISIIIGVVAFALLLVFVLGALLNRDLLVDGETVPAFRMVKQFKDHSVIILSLFVMFSLFVGLNKIGAIPDIYTDEFPQMYYKLVNDAASGKEKPVNGRYKYQVFKEKYDQLLQHDNIRNQ